MFHWFLSLALDDKQERTNWQTFPRIVIFPRNMGNSFLSSVNAPEREKPRKLAPYVNRGCVLKNLLRLQKRHTGSAADLLGNCFA